DPVGRPDEAHRGQVMGAVGGDRVVGPADRDRRIVGEVADPVCQQGAGDLGGVRVAPGQEVHRGVPADLPGGYAHDVHAHVVRGAVGEQAEVRRQVVGDRPDV